MNGKEPYMTDDDDADAKHSQEPAAGLSTQNQGSEWEKRRTVLREIVHRSLSSNNVPKRRWDPNLWRLDYQGVLSILRAEALRSRAQPQSRETTKAVNEVSDKSDASLP